MSMQRRGFLKSLSGVLAGAALPTAGGVHTRSPGASGPAVMFFPGYAHESAYFQGRPVAKHPAFAAKLPRGYDGPLTLVTRLDERDGSLRRALMPLRGHQIDISPDGRQAVFDSMDGPEIVSFDPVSLEIGVIAPMHAGGFICGGHSAYTMDGRALLVVERADWRPFSGRIADHFGRIVVRDPETLQVLSHFSCHGIAPHQIVILEDGKHLAVANYGRTDWLERDGMLPEIIEPSLTVLDIASGKLVDKVASDDRRFEVRHVAAQSLHRIFAIQSRLATTATTREGEAKAASSDVYEPDVWSTGLADYGQLSAPVLRYDLHDGGRRVTPVITADAQLMRYAQSMIFDARYDEAIGTFPTQHCVIVFDGRDGHIKRVNRVDQMGVRQPRGIFLHPDGLRYGVSGYWMDLLMFRRGTHELDREASHYLTFFGHSHSTAMPA